MKVILEVTYCNVITSKKSHLPASEGTRNLVLEGTQS